MTTTRRTRGRPPAIRLDDVIEAAADTPLEELTIQGVAERLGVTRAAIYHYVDNVDQLRRLAARAAMVELSFDHSAAGSWQEWIEGWARAIRRWRIANGTAGPGMFLTADVLVSESLLAAIEHAVVVLIESGFPEEEAARGVQFLIGMIWINTQDELVAAGSPDGVHPQVRALVESEVLDSDALEVLRRADPFTNPDRRFEHELGLAVEALESRLARLSDS